MKFTLTTTGIFYPDAKKRAKLEEIGFIFQFSDSYKEFSIKGSPEIELNSLEELILFANKYGEIIVGDGKIEIYDSYRE